MKRSFTTFTQVLGFCVAAVLSIGCGQHAEPLDRAGQIWALYHGSPETVLVVAHRGAHRDVPENSLAAVDRAIEMGAHFVEVDVRQTKDGVFVVMHDRTLDRTTTGRGEVAEHTYAELQSLRLLHNGKPTEHTIPTMEEVLRYAKGRILVDIDFKAHGLQARFDAFDEIQRLDAEGSVVFFCYDYTELPVLHAYNPRIKIMPRAYDLVQLKHIVESGLTDIVHVDGSYYNDEAITKLIGDKPIRVWANVLGKHDQEAARLGASAYRSFFRNMALVNVVQTDHPHLLSEFLERAAEVAMTESP